MPTSAANMSWSDCAVYGFIIGFFSGLVLCLIISVCLLLFRWYRERNPPQPPPPSPTEEFHDQPRSTATIRRSKTSRNITSSYQSAGGWYSPSKGRQREPEVV
jgi:hypothetical protein